MIEILKRRHRRVKNMLYDFHRQALDPAEEQIVRDHLGRCGSCAADLEELAAVCSMVPGAGELPSGTLPDEYWQEFAAGVGRRILEESGESPRPAVTPARLLPLFDRRWILGAVSGAAFVAACVAAVILFRPAAPQPGSKSPGAGSSSPEIPAVTATEVDPAGVAPEFDAERMHEYFRKSKVLLVGLANIHTEPEEEIDLSAERRASRSLVREARYLQDQPLDHRSARLIGDLQKILIELANMKDRNGAPEVQILQGGIHRENLLFKIRMAETMFDSTQLLRGTE
jgi:hypothetical protein